MIVDIVWVLVLIFYDIPSANKLSNFKLMWNQKNLNFLFKSGFFIFLINFFSVYIVNAPKYALDGRVADSLQAIFGIILMPATLVSLAIQYFVQPYLQKLALLFNELKKKNLIFNHKVSVDHNWVGYCLFSRCFLVRNSCIVISIWRRFDIL